MRYLVLLVGYAEKSWPELTEAEQGEWMNAHGRVAQTVEATPGCHIVVGEELTDGADATVQRNSSTGSPTLTDGPYTEATEAIGGFYVIDAPDLDTLTGLLRGLPPYIFEIRPVASH